MIYLLAALFGLCIGSFLNVCIHRLPRGESVVSPGSRCAACGVPIRWYDNLPVVGYLMLGGKCRACGATFSARYLAVELITAAVFVMTAAAFDVGPLLAVRLIFAAMLVALFFIDLEHQLLPDAITWPGIVIGLVASVWLTPGWMASVAGAALGALILLAIRWAWKRATGVDGMGLGDVKMLAMIGAFLGWQQVWLVLFVASLAGAVIGVAMTTLGKGSMKTRLPFGTFLAIAALLSSIFGEPVITWYVGLITLR